VPGHDPDGTSGGSLARRKLLVRNDFESRADTGRVHDYRFNSLHQRDSRSALFEGYSGGGADSTRRQLSGSPASVGGGYGYGGYAGNNTSSSHLGVGGAGYRPATPNKR
jgi:hypothetical protein